MRSDGSSPASNPQHIADEIIVVDKVEDNTTKNIQPLTQTTPLQNKIKHIKIYGNP